MRSKPLIGMNAEFKRATKAFEESLAEGGLQQGTDELAVAGAEIAHPGDGDHERAGALDGVADASLGALQVPDLLGDGSVHSPKANSISFPPQPLLSRGARCCRFWRAKVTTTCPSRKEASGRGGAWLTA